jgi:hypothetical protein
MSEIIRSENGPEPVRKNGWIYVTLKGEPYERGRQHGNALAKELKYAIDIAKYMAKWDTGDEFTVFTAAAEKWKDYLDKEYEQELRGIVAGAKEKSVDITFEELLVWNGYSELLGGWWPQRDQAPSSRIAMLTKGGLHRCSAFIATGDVTEGGKVVMAHNSWDRYATGDNYNVIFNIQPPKGQGHQMVMQGAPGYITSNMDWVVTKIGEDGGLMICETTIGGFTGKFHLDQEPEFQRSRRAAQYSNTLGEWCNQMVKNNNGGYANTWLVGDAKSHEIGYLDLGSQYYEWKTKTDGYYAGYNVAASLPVRNQECRDPNQYSDIRGNGSRRLRFHQLFTGLKDRGEKVTIDVAKSMIADHYDVYNEKKDAPCSRTICGHLELDKGETSNHGQPPYYPWGANDGKVTDSGLVTSGLQFWARWGNSCGMEFDGPAFVTKHPQYDWLEGKMKKRDYQNWTLMPLHGNT